MTNETNNLAASYVQHFAAPLIAKAKAYDNADKKHGKTYATAMQRDDAAAVFGYCVKAVANADAAADAVETGKNDARRASLKKAGVECLAYRELRNELSAYRMARKECAMDCMTTDEIAALLATIKEPITTARFAMKKILKGQNKANKQNAAAAGASGETEADETLDNATDAAPVGRAELFAQFLDVWKKAGHGNAADFWDWTATQECQNAEQDKQAEQVKADKASGPTLPQLQSIAG